MCEVGGRGSAGYFSQPVNGGAWAGGEQRDPLDNAFEQQWSVAEKAGAVLYEIGKTNEMVEEEINQVVCALCRHWH